ncbi:MAG: hypothetical protein PHV03_08495 [Desulfitobacteriaceae bacterium]|nr:hypothetical protein [Desulfitobacteriaceae bacterium]
MKKTYEKPTIEIIEFEVEDIMASGLYDGGDGTGDEMGWGEIR